MSGGSIIIAAHNEESVIARTLAALADVRETGDIRVFVVCNGCSDRTAQLARTYAGVEVIEIAVASKAAALREGDRQAGPGPRIYLDADIVLTSRAARRVCAALVDGALAARPPHRFDSHRAHRAVRSWYRVREQLPSISSALWGAGCYALSEDGRARFAEFPDVVSDDLFIDSLFQRHEITIVPTDALIVTTPRRTADLIRILRRSYRTQIEVAAGADSGEFQVFSSGQRRQFADLRSLLVHRPRLWWDVAIYLAIIAVARVRAQLGSSRERWERDESSRQ